jgi:8-oxo-dGTP diphosphatase
VTIYLVRHAHAGDRDEWDGPDHERPLSRRGRVQADALADALAAAPIRRVMSSPAVRCLQSVGALASRLHLEVEPARELAEGTSARRVVGFVDDIVAASATGGDHAGDVVLCTHGDVIPALLEQLQHDGVPLHGIGCAKGSVWVLRTRDGHVESGTYFREPNDLSVNGA